MDAIFNGLNDWIISMMVDFIGGNLEVMIAGANNQTAELASLITAQPSVWNANIWQMITAVADRVILPIAAGILTYAACMELIEWANDKNSFRTNSDIIKKLFWSIFKIGMGAALVSKAGVITLGIFDLGAWVISQSAGIQTTPAELIVSLDAIKQSLEDLPLGTLMGLTFSSLIGGIGMQVLGLLARIIVTSRMIEIYIYCSVGSAPYATLTNQKLSGIGANYIKNILALAFQGFFMFIMLGIYSVLIQDTIVKVADGASATNLITELLFISLVFGFSLLRSKAIAKSIFTAQ